MPTVGYSSVAQAEHRNGRFFDGPSRPSRRNRRNRDQGRKLAKQAPRIVARFCPDPGGSKQPCHAMICSDLLDGVLVGSALCDRLDSQFSFRGRGVSGCKANNHKVL